jgi:hypothetical protein
VLNKTRTGEENGEHGIMKNLTPYSSANIIGMAKSRNMRWAERVECNGV